MTGPHFPTDRPGGRTRVRYGVLGLTVAILVALFAMQSRGTAKVAAFFGPVMVVWFVAIGLDRRYHASDVPLALQALGLAMLVFSTGFIMWVMRENSFAAPVVKVQTERGHHVVSTGPYAFVRHPMYSGALLFFVGAALLLGSWWGLAMSLLFAVLFAIRSGIEERALIAGLPGYAREFGEDYIGDEATQGANRCPTAGPIPAAATAAWCASSAPPILLW